MTTPQVPQLPEEAIAEVRKWADKVGGYTKMIIDEALKLIRMGLGNPVKVNLTRTAWNTTAVNDVASGLNGINNAIPELQSRWTGPAFISFNRYHGLVVTASNKVTTALTGVGTALSNALAEVTKTYQAVVGLVGGTGQAILEYIGSTLGAIDVNVAALLGDVAGEIVKLLAKLAAQYTEAVRAALGIIQGYKDAANGAVSAVAGLGENLVPALPASAGDAGSYMPVKQPD